MGMMATMGSPPRMREKLKSSKIPSGCLRITPAYAGKTKSSLLNLVVVQDHPRVCGKNHFKSLISNLVAGSPPRMREKPGLVDKVNEWARITPAYAGKTVVSGMVQGRRRDHPRVCGKNLHSISKLRSSTGITPAYAGKTCIAVSITPRL